MDELGAGTSGINPHHGYALLFRVTRLFFLSLSLFCAEPETLRDAAPSIVRVQCAGRRGTRTTPARSPGAPPAAPPPSSAPASAPSRSASTEAVRARADLLWPLLCNKQTDTITLTMHAVRQLQAPSGCRRRCAVSSGSSPPPGASPTPASSRSTGRSGCRGSWRGRSRTRSSRQSFSLIATRASFLSFFLSFFSGVVM
jgi:hypothetical protein